MLELLLIFYLGWMVSLVSASALLLGALAIFSPGHRVCWPAFLAGLVHSLYMFSEGGIWVWTVCSFAVIVGCAYSVLGGGLEIVILLLLLRGSPPLLFLAPVYRGVSV